MHELSLLENVREILEQQAISQQFSRVLQVTLAVGKLSCVEPEALRFGFDVVMKGSLAESAVLVITELPGLGYCHQCHQTIEMEVLYDACYLCGNPLLTIQQGTELRVKDLIVI